MNLPYRLMESDAPPRQPRRHMVRIAAPQNPQIAELGGEMRRPQRPKRAHYGFYFG